MPHIDFPQSFCQAALARRDITPPIGMYHRMWGAAKHDRSTGIHRPLSATVLALRASDANAAAGPPLQILASIDHCLMWTKEMEALRQSICKAANIELDQLHVTFSHTHAAGMLDPGRVDLPGGDLIGPYLDQLVARLGEAAGEAIGRLQPATIVYGTGRCDLARNRDFWDAASGQFVCGFNPEGECDDTLLVARIDDNQNRTLGTIVNYACHPTTLAWDNTLVSPDYVGAMRELIEGAHGGLCLFLQGASGDLGPRDGFVGDTAVADRNGRQLGYAALAALESLPPAGKKFEYTGPVVSGATIGTWAYLPISQKQRIDDCCWQCQTADFELAYRDDLPTREQTESDLARWQTDEQAAREAGDAARAADCRAHAERMMRQLTRLHSLPPGKTIPLPVAIWRLGDAIWVTLPGEHYHYLQRALRSRFPAAPIIVTTITNGWLPGYVPSRDTYGRGIYQESIAICAPGSLEDLTSAIGDRVESLLTN